MSSIFRKGQSYSLADARPDPVYNNDVVGVFRRNESVAIRGKVKAGGVQKLLDDLSEKETEEDSEQRRRGSEGVKRSLDVTQYLDHARRNSSPTIKTEDLPRMRRKKNSVSR